MIKFNSSGPFRNAAKRECALEINRTHHGIFLSLFGADAVAGTGREVNASGLRDAAAGEWAGIQERVLTVLAARPYDYIVFLLLTLRDVPLAWAEALRLDVDSDDLWTRLVDAYQQLDPAAVVPVLRRLIESDLRVADVGNYRSAVKRLRQLREQHRNRPRFLQELDRAKFL